jgi:hypothetical protein
MIFKKNPLKYSSKEKYVLDKGHVDKGIGWYDQISVKSLTSVGLCTQSDLKFLETKIHVALVKIIAQIISSWVKSWNSL